MGTAGPSKKVTTYQTTQCDIPDNRNFQDHAARLLPCMNITPWNIQDSEGMLLISALDAGKWLDSCPSCFIPCGQGPRYHWISHKWDLELVWTLSRRRMSAAPAKNWTLVPCLGRPWLCHCTNWAIPAPTEDCF